MILIVRYLMLLTAGITLASCSGRQVSKASPSIASHTTTRPQQPIPRLASAAESIQDPDIVYDGRYYTIDYPNGDVPEGTGVCTDVVIRSFRKIGIDLQKEVHEDMQQHFNVYPQLWGNAAPDPNIDHRRVPNLMCYFARKGYALPVTKQARSYKAGDIVAWRLAGGLTHIGILTGIRNQTDDRYLVMHNIGRGQVLEDCLFQFELIGHYRLP